MSQIQLQGLLKARQDLKRARQEFDRAKLHSTAYRGLSYVAERQPQQTHGTFLYRGQSYSK